MSITRINNFSAADGKCEELSTFLQSLILYITNSAGNISCEVLRHQDSEEKFIVIEKWQDVASHQLSLANFPIDKMQAAMELFGQPPSSASYLSI